MNNTRAKDGPIHFYPTNDRDAFVANVVEYCVQIGEHQPLTRSQAGWLVASKQVLVDGAPMTNLVSRVPSGTWEISIRGRKHHVVVHQAMVE